MLIFLLVIIILACLILAFFVLIQDSKGGGLASNFASSNQIMGVRKTTDFLEKATWSLAAGIMILCLACAFITKSDYNKERPSKAETEQTTQE
ncbi:MAG TPA: preprotein translocase subunit SecG [Bacteroidales bacterium]|jgi:preprotein translocase subunit SecG|nr:preprotein translocase subunit SecG [Bacteroidales bacterium]HOS57789.1 preprotein translocase subunit SecG [Bacteroidales bacterium]HQA86639.1 preprotein translocase subunit SecG [Bacteroidales bacterium]HRT13382.1 preprotein translocase subunit SecG [Bacteroidales bacterium]HXK73376.1 preprotein translocase subunit SecG [Bacteroidales bacterium]